MAICMDRIHCLLFSCLIYAALLSLLFKEKEKCLILFLKNLPLHQKVSIPKEGVIIDLLFSFVGYTYERWFR